MTVEAAPGRARKPRRVNQTQTPENLAIGEIEATVFACPGCARPLPLGARRCPACKTHLVLRVQAKRAAVFVGAGLVVGLVLGGGGVAGASILGGMAGTSPAPGSTVSAEPTTAVSASARPTVRPTATPGVAPITRSALAGVAAIDVKLKTASAALSAALAARKFDATAISATFRGISADYVFGLQLVPYLRGWPSGDAVATQLAAFYGDLRVIAAEGLSASIRNETAYRAAATKMIDRLAAVDAIDLAVRAAAADAGVTIDPLPTPAP